MSDNKDNTIIYLLCAPGFVLIDTWLPVIKTMKETKNTRVYFVFPQPSSLALVNNESQLFRMSELYIDGVIFKHYTNDWLSSKSLDKAKKIGAISRANRKILQLAGRLIRGRLSRIPGMPIMGKTINLFIASKEKVKLMIKYNRNLFIDKLDQFGPVSAILYDMTAEAKACNNEFIEYFKKTPKFSMYHGPATRWLKVGYDCNSNEASKHRDDTVVFANSPYEIEGYKKCYGISERNAITSGVVRHDPKWMDYVLNNANIENNKIVFDDFVFLISRPASPYLPVERKKKTLNEINSLICNELNKKIVIKPHPKEDIHGLDGELYMDIFGKENYGVTWCYSELHSFVLGSKCEFAISFFSCVPTDLIALGKSTVEYLDLRGINRFDNKNSRRDNDGHPVFSERYANLVLGASDYQQFKSRVYNIIDNKSKTFDLLKDKYNYYYPTHKNTSQVVSENIFNYISKK